MTKRGPDPDADVLDVEGAMILLKLGRNTIYEGVASGQIPHRRIGKLGKKNRGRRKVIRFSRAALLRWLDSASENVLSGRSGS